MTNIMRKSCTLWMPKPDGNQPWVIQPKNVANKALSG